MTVTIEDLKAPPRGPAPSSDVAEIPLYTADLMTSRGAALSFRIAERIADSSLIPEPFRRFKRVRGRYNRQIADYDADTFEENQGAVANIIVMAELSRSMDLPLITLLMNAQSIDGKLAWSAPFLIACIQQTGRFETLRFDLGNRGPVTAIWRKPSGWDKATRSKTFIDVPYTVEDLTCQCWTVPKGTKVPAGVATLAQAKAAGLPVIEGTKVSLRMAVEEGWYGREGSKWAGELQAQMLQYRAGAFFARVHAASIVAGFGGHTAEELEDMRGIDVQAREIPAAAAQNVTELRPVHTPAAAHAPAAAPAHVQEAAPAPAPTPAPPPAPEAAPQAAHDEPPPAGDDSPADDAPPFDPDPRPQESTGPAPDAVFEASLRAIRAAESEHAMNAIASQVHAPEGRSGELSAAVRSRRAELRSGRPELPEKAAEVEPQAPPRPVARARRTPINRA